MNEALNYSSNRIEYGDIETENIFGVGHFENVFEISPIGMSIVALNGSILSTNASLCLLLGYSKEELLKKNFQDITYSEDMETDLAFAQKLIDGEINDYQMEKRYIHKSGKIVYALLSKTAIRDKNGHLLYFLGQIQDITRRKEIEQSLKITEERYRGLIEALPDSIAVLDYDWRYVMINEAAVETMTKISKEKIIGVKLTDFQPGVEDTSFFNEYKAVMEDRKPRTITDEYTFADGRHGYFEVRILPVDEGIMLIGLDLTKRIESEKRIIEVLEMDKLRTEFFANLSHELRTPLNIILFSTQLMDKTINAMGGEKNSNLSKYVKMSKQNCYRLLKMINNLIDTTKLDSGFLVLYKKQCNIVSIVEEITLSVKDYLRTKNINLLFDAVEEEIITDIDPNMIERVMLNLLSNAYKFTPVDGNINVNVGREDNNIIIEVTDSGIGIPEDKLESIFERFSQVDKSTARAFEGSGIGLSLSKSLIELHGGSISVESKINTGTKFTINLPIINEKNINPTYEDCIPSRVEKIEIEFSDIYSVDL